MSKKFNTPNRLFNIVLTNATNSFHFTCQVWARNEDTAMDIALRRYKEQELEVYDVVLA